MLFRKNKFSLCVFIMVIMTAAVLHSSCASQQIKFPEQKRKIRLRGRKVVVSNFYLLSHFSIEKLTGVSGSAYSGYRTHHYQRRTRRRKHDLSYQLARYLRRHGIRARAVKRIRKSQVRNGEVLLQGVVATSGKTDLPLSRVPFFFLLIGNILPNPFGFPTGASVGYGYEIMNNRGAILYNSGMKKGDVTYKYYWVWPFLFTRETNYPKARTKARNVVFKEILTTLRR